MTQQPLIDAYGHRGGLWSRVLDADRFVDGAAWRYHLDAGQHVGVCRHGPPDCGQPLTAGEPYKVGSRDAYPAVCTAPDRHEAVAYGPRPAKKKERSC